MRIENEPAYVLETRPYRETSVLLEVITPAHGRLALVARGVRGEGRRQGTRRAALEPFQRLQLAASGRGEVLTLSAVESVGPPLRPVGAPLFAAWYVNELVQRLTGRGDAAPALFARYVAWLDELASLLSSTSSKSAAGAAPVGVAEVQVDPGWSDTGDEGAALAWSLRRFERDLLALLGYDLALDQDNESGEAVQADADYSLDPEHGARPWSAGSVWPRVRGSTLLAWAGETPPAAACARELKQLARALLRHHLGGGELRAWRLAAQWRVQRSG